LGFIDRQFIFIIRNERKLQKSYTKKKGHNIDVKCQCPNGLVSGGVYAI